MNKFSFFYKLIHRYEFLWDIISDVGIFSPYPLKG